MKRLLVIVVGFFLYCSNGYAHSFSTSFLNIQSTADGLQIRWQLTFHDLVALNKTWLNESQVNRAMLNSHLDELQRFSQQSLQLMNDDQQCSITLSESSPWSAVNLAKENYIVIELNSDCAVELIDSVGVAKIWDELVDHKVVVEGDYLAGSKGYVTLSQSEPRFAGKP